MASIDPSVLEALRVPNALGDDVGQVLALTDGFCRDHLGDEYRDVIRRMVAKLARKRPSPLTRGDLRSGPQPPSTPPAGEEVPVAVAVRMSSGPAWTVTM